MKLLILALLAVTAYAAVPQGKANALECSLCHFIGPLIEEAAEKEAEEGKTFFDKECNLIPIEFIDSLCKKFVDGLLDEAIAFLKEDESRNGQEACHYVLGCN